jgi:hypothetical protein
MIVPARSLNSSYWRSRSASRTFCRITCLADCAAIRPISTGGTSSTNCRPPWDRPDTAWPARRSSRPGSSPALRLDHGAHAGEGRAAGLAVDRHANVHLGAVAALGGAGEAFFHRLDDQRGRSSFRARPLRRSAAAPAGWRCDCHGLSPPQTRLRSQSRQTCVFVDHDARGLALRSISRIRSSVSTSLASTSQSNFSPMVPSSTLISTSSPRSRPARP